MSSVDINFFVSLQRPHSKHMDLKQIIRFEPYLFILLTILGALPILGFRYYPTLDGPAHQYNAQLIRHMLQGDAPLLSVFFEFNKEPLPNWSGHALLLIFNFFLPSFLAEKALMLCYFLGLPLAFRYLIIGRVSGKPGLSYLILPFVHTFFFVMGFYNFSLALVFFFLAAGFWVRLSANPSGLKLAVMAMLITCTYFSHVLVFLILLFALSISIFTEGLKESRGRIIGFLYAIKQKVFYLGLCSSFCLILFSVYYFKHHATDEKQFLSKTELNKMIGEVRPLITLNSEVQSPNTTPLFYIFTGLLAICVILRMVVVMKTKGTLKEQMFASFSSHDSWLLLSLLVLFLYYFLPDSDGQAGYVQAGFISMRLCLLFYLCLLVWFCFQNLPGWLIVVVVICSSWFHIQQISYHYDQAGEINPLAEECHDASLKLEANKLVLPINNSPNWLVGHFSNYLGHEKPIVIAENYEVTSNYFPLHLRYGHYPSILMGSKLDTLCNYWIHQPGLGTIKADYVFVLGKDDEATDTCSLRTHRILAKEYTLTYEGTTVRLYKLK
jgi:hypothetical protein